MILANHLHMPSYCLKTFTECPYNCVPVGERPAKCVSCLNSFLVGQENVRKNIIVNRMKPAKCLPVLGAIIY